MRSNVTLSAVLSQAADDISTYVNARPSAYAESLDRLQELLDEMDAIREELDELCGKLGDDGMR
jgi:hypothetical protein